MLGLCCCLDICSENQKTILRFCKRFYNNNNNTIREYLQDVDLELPMLRYVLVLYIFLSYCYDHMLIGKETGSRPNIILIMADDQGYGDLSCHGNPVIRTPNIDQFAKQSSTFERFYVCPVCSPTRSSLMTGRWNYRTGIIDTYLGRSMMFPDETTIAEILKANGYRTGIFGKWHLGDNYPLRSIDQGFDESLVLKGGGIGQPSDPPGGNGYFDPVLVHNGKLEAQIGYCSNIYTDAAISFITKQSDKPFFVYLPFNCPHEPLQVPREDYELYRSLDLSEKTFPMIGNPPSQKWDTEKIAKLYGMVSNIDDNVGKLLKKLDETKLTQNTIVIFLSDNGPAFPRWNAGLRSLKTTVYEGGIRAPFYIRYPGVIAANKKIPGIAAHIDLLPTLLSSCNIPFPKSLKIDGIDLWPILTGKQKEVSERNLFFQWHRGDTPQEGFAYTVVSSRYKLLQSGHPTNPTKKKAKPPANPVELYDLSKDPYEKNNIASEYPDIVHKMKNSYHEWFSEMKYARNFKPPEIILGNDKELTSILTRQDWRGPLAGWRTFDEGYWQVKIEKERNFRIELYFTPQNVDRELTVRFLNSEKKEKIPANVKMVAIESMKLPMGNGKFEATISGSLKSNDPKKGSTTGRSGVSWVQLEVIK